MRHTYRIAAVSLAAAIVAVPAIAAPGDGTTEHFFTIEISEGRTAAQGDRLAVEAIDWTPGRHDLGSWSKAQGLDVSWDVVEYRAGDGGNRAVPGRVTKVDGFSVKQKTVEHTSSGEKGGTEDMTIGVGELAPSRRPVGTSDLTMKRGTRPAKTGPIVMEPLVIKQKPPRCGPGGGFGGQKCEWATGGANETLTIGGNRTETRRRTRNLGSAIRGAELSGNEAQFADPPPQGTMRVKVRMPWLACQEGKFVPQLIAGNPVKSYILSDAVVTGCSASHVTIAYSKVEFQRTKPH